MKRILTIMISALMLASCSTIQNLATKPVMTSSEPALNAAWQGCRYNDIVRAFGAPTRSAGDGDGGTIYVYEETKTRYTTSTDTFHVGNTIDSETTVETKRLYTEFYVSSDDRCYLVRSNRTEPTGELRFAPVKAFVSLTSAGIMLVTIGGVIGLML